MATFTLNKTVTTREPVVEVDAPPRPGRYVFELVVVNEQGQRSPPVRATVVVRRRIVGPVVPPGPRTRPLGDEAASGQVESAAAKPRGKRKAAAGGSPAEQPAEKPAQKPKRTRKSKAEPPPVEQPVAPKPKRARKAK